MINPRGQEPWPRLHWSTFVPEGTPEHTAIIAANDLAEYRYKKGLPPRQENIERLQTVLFEKLDLVDK